MFIESSRQVISRAQPGLLVEGTRDLLDRVEALIDQMVAGLTRAQIDALVVQVGPLTNEAAARMNIVSVQVAESQTKKG